MCFVFPPQNSFSLIILWLCVFFWWWVFCVCVHCACVLFFFFFFCFLLVCFYNMLWFVMLCLLACLLLTCSIISDYEVMFFFSHSQPFFPPLQNPLWRLIISDLFYRETKVWVNRGDLSTSSVWWASSEGSVLSWALTPTFFFCW